MPRGGVGCAVDGNKLRFVINVRIRCVLNVALKSRFSIAVAAWHDILYID